MKLILVFMATLLLVQPAIAQQLPDLDGTKPLLVFHHKSPDEPEIVWSKPENLLPSDHWYRFEPINGCWVAQDYTFNAVGYLLKRKPEPTQPADTDGFIREIDKDDAIPLQFQMYIPLLCRVADFPQRRRMIWQRIKDSRPAWLSVPIIETIEAVSAAHRMGLQ